MTYKLNSLNQWLLQTTFSPSIRLRRNPDVQAERDLVDEVSQIVDKVHIVGGNSSAHVSEEVPQRVDGPTNSDDESHGAESISGSLADALSLSCTSSFAEEDLE